MQKQVRWSPAWWVPLFFYSLAFSMHRFGQEVKDKESFFRWCREFERWVFVKLTYPPGRYGVKEIEPGVFQISTVVMRSRLTQDKK